MPSIHEWRRYSQDYGITSTPYMCEGKMFNGKFCDPCQNVQGLSERTSHRNNKSKFNAKDIYGTGW